MADVRAPYSFSLAGWVGALRRQLSRPLSSYYLLLGASLMLLTIGLMMVLSASSVYSYRAHGNSYQIAQRQLTWIALGLPVAALATRLPRRLIRWTAWPAVLVSTVLLYLPHTPLGVTVNGNRNWVAIGSLQIQPSEIAKLAIVIWAADVYARKDKLLADPRHAIIPVVPVVGLIAGMVILQRDLGTALVLFAILLGMLWVVGLPARLFLIMFSVIGVAAFYLAASNDERRSRLTSFIDPFQDFQGDGWQSGHGLLGMASGGILGKGISASQQKWGNLPEAHTDFIFAVLGEELGMVGALLVIGLFGTIAFAAIRLAISTEDPFVRYLTAGVTIWMMAQMMINIGMVLALLPVIGIPLPLVSYGGSALLPSMVALGLLIGFARTEPEAAAALGERKRSRTEVGATVASGARTARASRGRPESRGAARSRRPVARSDRRR